MKTSEGGAGGGGEVEKRESLGSCISCQQKDLLRLGRLRGEEKFPCE